MSGIYTGQGEVIISMVTSVMWTNMQIECTTRWCYAETVRGKFFWALGKNLLFPP